MEDEMGGMDAASLRSMKQSALQKYAIECGATDDEVDEAVDADDAKSALVLLILGKQRNKPAVPRPAPLITSSSSEPLRLAVNQPFLQLEGIPPGQFVRRNSNTDDLELAGIGPYHGNSVDDDDDEYPVAPDSPMTIGRTNSIRSNREEIEPRQSMDMEHRRSDKPMHHERSARSEKAMHHERSARSEKSMHHERSAPSGGRGSNDPARDRGKANERRGSHDPPNAARRRGSQRRGSQDYSNAASRRTSAEPYGYGSRRASYASTAYDDDDEAYHRPPPMLPPFGGMMPPPMGMMPPMGMGPPGMGPPPGFMNMNGNPWAVAAQLAAMGPVPGMPMMPPPGYPNPLFAPPMSPMNQDLHYPPHFGVGHTYSMPGVHTERRGSNADRRGSFGDGRTQRKGSTGQAMTSTNSHKSDRAHAEPKTTKPDEQTTLLLRNLPEIFTRSTLQNLLDDKGFKGRYDFIYMPMNFRTKASFGYAFVNFVGMPDAQQCFTIFQGYTGWNVPSQKVCDVSWSNMHQGLPAHIDRYRNSPVMHESVDDEYKPAVFQAGTGARAIFPPPTKKLRVPRIRRPGADGAGDDEDM